jgi:hypothetical protein
MKTWILGTEYDFADTKSVKRLLDVIDSCGANSARQIALGLLTTVIGLASQNDKLTGELPTEYYCLSCIDGDCQGFSVFHAFNPLKNVNSDVMIIRDAYEKGIIDNEQYSEINDVKRITKEEYERGMNA